MDKIVVENLGKRIGEQEILKNIDLELSSGKIYGLIGRNGSGKTVLLKCIAGFMEATEGFVSINDMIIGKDIRFMPNMGFIINSPGFLPELSGMKNLEYLASFNGKIGKEKIREVMKLVGLDPNSRKGVGKYSTGMKQRLGIAQAIMENPDILILDEPMNGLDENMVNDMRTLFSRLREEGKLIIITSHICEDIDILCDEVYQVKNGTMF